MGLLDAENCASFYLCEAATLDDAVDLQSETGLEPLAFGIGETNIGKHVAAAFFEGHASWFLSRHGLIAPEVGFDLTANVYSAIDSVICDMSLGNIFFCRSNTKRFFPPNETSPESILPSRV